MIGIVRRRKKKNVYNLDKNWTFPQPVNSREDNRPHRIKLKRTEFVKEKTDNYYQVPPKKNLSRPDYNGSPQDNSINRAYFKKSFRLMYH